jgi:amino acid adenylation domain-containing protein
MTTKNVWQIGAEDPDDLQLLIQAERRRDRDKGSASVRVEAARSATERWVAQTFAELLGVDRVGVDDDFFALGGHSLLATQVIARVRGTFRLDAPLEWILEAPTVERLARQIDGAREDGALSLSEEEPLPSCAAAPAARHEPFALTAIQQAYWMGRSPAFELGSISTHVYLEYETSERLDVTTLERAWQRLVERHDMLRAVIEPDGLQRVLKEVPAYRIELMDLSTSTASEAAMRLERIRGEMSHHVFETTRWPLFDIRVTRLPGGTTRTHFGIDILIVDAGSLAVLFQEWERFYREPNLELTPLRVTFRDYMAAVAKQTQSKTHRRSADYWEARLSTLPPAPQLPAAKTTRSLERPRFVRRMETLDAALWSRLKKQAATADVTPATLLATAFGDVLATWSRGPQFTLNLTLFNRLPLHPDVGNVVGDFTSVTLLEMTVPPCEDFRTRVQRVQRQLWKDIDHSHVSGVEVLRQIARRQSAGVMMPVVFTSMLGLTRSLGGRSPVFGTEVYGISQTPQVTLDHIVLGEDGGALRYCWDAIEDLFPAGMLDAMFSAYRHRLDELADGRWEEEGSSLVPEVQQGQYARANATEAAVEPGLLHAPFVEKARSHPERVAVVSSERTLTYADLARESRRLGRKLRDLGAQPNELVAIVMERGWEQVVGVLGVLEAGAAYVPIDADLPAERRFHLLERCAVRAIVTQRRVDQAGPWPEGIQRICVDGGLDDLSDEVLPPAQAPTDLAYVIFTSGSTGTPKGVMIDHYAALNTVRDVNERHGVTHEDKVLAISSLSFDLSVYDIFGILGAGATMVLVAPGETREPARWAQLVEHHGITLWNSVPALMQMLVDDQEGRGKRALRSLRVVLLSGDWVPVGLPDRLRALVDGVRVVSMGGATEASIWSIDYPIARVDPTWTSIPYGKPMKNQRWYVLDGGLEIRPVWVPGELYIAGMGLARGYWRDPQRTEERFFHHPKTGERLYRTGDWGRYWPDGDIEFLGREDGQVKVRGFRIELGEIDAAASVLPHVREALTATYVDVSGQKSLAIYIVPHDGVKIDAAAIKAALAAKMPEYMVPSQVVLLDAMPLSPNGKVDRKALPSPTSTATGPSFVAPRTERERKLAEIWQTLLQKERVGVTDNFFALGGHSLIALMLVSRARELGLEFALATVLQHPTIEGLLASLETKKASTRHVVTLNPHGKGTPLVLMSGAGGFGFVFQGLARMLGEDQRVIILNAIGAEGDGDVVDYSIEEMAAIYEPEILAVCGEGPIVLGGYSFGALVAYELVRRLKERGRHVPLLVSFDGFAPRFPKPLPLPQRVLSHLKTLIWGDSTGRRAYMRNRLARMRGRYFMRMGRPEEAQEPVPFADPATDLRLRKLLAALSRASRVYNPLHVVRSELLLIKTRIPERWIGSDMDDPLYGWTPCIDGLIEISTVDGRHLTLFQDDNVRRMAQTIAAAIRRHETRASELAAEQRHAAL